MKRKIIYIFIFVITVASFAMPNLVFASWWNPFSWSWFSKPVQIQPAQVITAIETPEPVSEPVQATTTANIEVKRSANVISESVPLRPTKTIPSSVKPAAPPCDQDCLEHQAFLKRSQEEMKKQEAVMMENDRVRRESLANVAEAVNIQNNDQRVIAIKAFLENPTFDNYKTFCSKAKDLQGWTSKQVLDANRQNLITVNATLYDDTNCKILERSDITIYSLPDASLNIPFLDNDSDKVRTSKIHINQFVSDLSKTNKFTIFEHQKFNFADIDGTSFAGSALGYLRPTGNFNIAEMKVKSFLFSPADALRLGLNALQ